jgi:hypothetical protein
MVQQKVAEVQLRTYEQEKKDLSVLVLFIEEFRLKGHKYFHKLIV